LRRCGMAAAAPDRTFVHELAIIDGPIRDDFFAQASAGRPVRFTTEGSATWSIHVKKYRSCSTPFPLFSGHVWCDRCTDDEGWHPGSFDGSTHVEGEYSFETRRGSLKFLC